MHQVFTAVTFLMSIPTISGDTLDAVSFKSLIFISVSSSSCFAVEPELPVVYTSHTNFVTTFFWFFFLTGKRILLALKIDYKDQKDPKH